MSIVTLTKVRLYTIYSTIAVLAGLAGGGGGLYLFDIYSDIILRDEAEQLFIDYGKNVESTLDHTFGGTFPKELVYDPISGPNNEYIGVRFWFCYKPGATPSVFLAGERVRSYSYPTTADEPTEAMLFSVSETFKYPAGTTKIMDYLEHTTLPAGRVIYIPKAEVKIYSDAFKDLLKNKPHYIDYTSTFFFYDNAKDFSALINQAPDVKYIRYCFGFDDKDKVNKVRVVLLGADANGLSYAGTNSVVLQKSVPPPPDM